MQVKPLSGQPYWHKSTMARLGFEECGRPDKLVVVPNMPSMCYKLFTVKHLVEIIPLKFPMGFPEDEEFDASCCQITPGGEFVYHPKLRPVEGSLSPTSPMKLKEVHVQDEVVKHWYSGRQSPLGNANFHRDTSVCHPEKTNLPTDQAFKVKYKDG